MVKHKKTTKPKAKAKPKTKRVVKKKVVKPVEPLQVDYVRTCECGNRVLVSVRRHGYIKILTVETNGYIAELRGAGPLRNTDLNKKLGFSFGEASDKDLLRIGVYRKFSKAEIAKFKANELNSKIPRLIVKSFRPKEVTWLHCEGCERKMSFRLFKEVKHIC